MTKVSVPIITYNQANFIGKAIESVLEQKTNFDFEILIGDDFSNDGTRTIITDYANRYPDKIVPVLHPKNLGRNGMFNTLETYKLAKGEYIASMDGDDYWTDPHKLQKQVDFLDAHPDFSVCFHNALITFEDGSPSELVNDEKQKAISTIEDLIGEDEIWFMATSSVLFRNCIKTYPKWFMESVSGDIPRYVLLAKKGKIGYLPEVMSVYRKNVGGTSFTDKYDDAVFLQNRINMYKGINQELDYAYDKTLKKNLARYYKMMLESRQYRDAYFTRLPIIWAHITYGQLPWPEAKEIIKTYGIPESVMKLYSAIALLPHRLKEKKSF
jgi:glycosyltransferase involved in cell wall biosynthesis